MKLWYLLLTLFTLIPVNSFSSGEISKKIDAIFNRAGQIESNIDYYQLLIQANELILSKFNNTRAQRINAYFHLYRNHKYLKKEFRCQRFAKKQKIEQTMQAALNDDIPTILAINTVQTLNADIITYTQAADHHAQKAHEYLKLFQKHNAKRLNKLRAKKHD